MFNKIKVEKRTDLTDLPFKVTLPAGKTFADVQDVIFLVKVKTTDALSNALISKTKSDFKIVLENTDQVKVLFEESDYSGLVIGQEYDGALLFKFIGDTDFNENIDHFAFSILPAIHN